MSKTGPLADGGAYHHIEEICSAGITTGISGIMFVQKVAY